MNSIARDVYVKRKALNSPISYVRATNAQELQFRFCDFAIPENTEARVYVQKPSGKAVYNNAVIEGDTVTVEVTTQMFSEVGQSYIQLHLVKGEKNLVTFTQTVDVLQNYTEGDAPESKNESGFFKEYEDRLDEATNAANTATAEVRKQMEEIAGAVEDATNAAGSANAAAGEANKAAEKAEKGASDAISAAETATEATEAANDAAKKANEVKNQIQEKADNGEFTGTIRIGDVTTGEPGTQASVENVGTDKDAVLNITIPKGETGEVENIDNVSLEFTEALERENIETGDSFGTIFGKIRKVFSDLEDTAFTAFDDLVKAILIKSHPIGSIYFSDNNTNPSELFGGEWVEWGSGRVPVGVNTLDPNFSTVEKMGGATSVKLTESEMPYHNHSVGAHTHGLNNHTHSIPALSGSTGGGGSHGHTVPTLRQKKGALGSSGTTNSYIFFNSAGGGGIPTSDTANHTHSVTTNGSTTGQSSGTTENSSAFNTGTAGSSSAHTNLQPYITCYMWKRIA